MGFKAHWFQFLFLFLCISTASYSKPLPVESTFKGDMCTQKTGKGVVHKIHARDVGSDFNNPEYLSALAENTDPHDADSITDYDAEDSEDESLDEHVSNSGDVIEIGGSRESSADEYEDGGYDGGLGDNDGVDYDEEHDEPDDTSDYDDYDDTFWGNDTVDDNEVRKNLPQEALDNDDDDIDSTQEASGSFGDDTNVVSPDDDGDAGAIVDVDDDNEINNESPDGIPNDDDTYGDDEVEGPMQVLEEPPSLKHIHKFDHKSKSSRPRNPLNKINDSKLGRLLKKHHNKDATRKNSVKKYLDDDINNDNEFGDFKLSNKRKEKIPRHKGRRTLSVSQNSDYSHVQKSKVIGSQDQRNGGNSVDRNVDDYDKQFLASRGDFFFENKQNVGSTSDKNVDKDNAQYVEEEDEIEGEEEENKMNDMDSSYSNNGNNVSEPGLTSDSVFEEDKVKREEEEEDNEITKDIENSSHKDDMNFDENEAGGNPIDDLTDDDEQNDIASGIDAP